MRPICARDNALVYAIAAYFDIGTPASSVNGRGGRAPMITSSVLLVLHRSKTPLHRERIIQASYCTPNCNLNNFRVILWSARGALGGKDTIVEGDSMLSLSPKGREVMDEAIRQIKSDFETALNGGRPMPTTLEAARVVEAAE